jgi:hypothetical protein
MTICHYKTKDVINIFCLVDMKLINDKNNIDYEEEQ